MTSSRMSMWKSLGTVDEHTSYSTPHTVLQYYMDIYYSIPSRIRIAFMCTLHFLRRCLPSLHRQGAANGLCVCARSRGVFCCAQLRN